MKFSCPLLLSLLSFFAGHAQQSPGRARHLFIITIDGFRWQEVFTGADPSLIADASFVRDTALTKDLYWDTTADLRRRRLMPFFWNVIAAKGQLYGNRLYNNKVNVKNFYKISYPGYNELFTGHTNGFISPNLPVYNRNRNVLEYLNATNAYGGKVVVFTSWNIFPFILNVRRNGLPINSGYQKQPDEADNEAIQLIDSVQQTITPRTRTRYDLLTWLNAKEYISSHHPSIAFIGLGETDEFAHEGRYDLYLQHAASIDRMLAELWYTIQTDPYYRDNTDFLITTDHGRGASPSSWMTHGFWAKGSGDIWLAALGPDILPEGEMRVSGQLYQKQLASTIAMLLGEPATAGRLPGKPIVFHVPETLARPDLSSR
ncbi:MAG TPA: hypothetical protein VK563_11695 [Puia sp.]|nr:hypothetical protein [Puia sp.]